ncbi:MAG TPA: hypothetical protein VGP93_20975 [Polyangiaceae bacterium]|nr:hypothetical protein [Polyangiaceae bacterium]
MSLAKRAWLLSCSVLISACGSGDPPSDSAAGATSGGATAAGGASGSAGASETAGAGGAEAATCGKIVYSGEPGEVTLADGSTWGDPHAAADGSTMFSETTDNPHSGTTALEIDLNWTAGYYGGAFGWNFAGGSAAKAIDIRDATDLELWIRANKNVWYIAIWLTDIAGKSSGRGGIGDANFYTTTQWQKVTLPASLFTGIDASQVVEFVGDTHADPAGSAGGVKLFFDDVTFVTPCP